MSLDFSFFQYCIIAQVEENPIFLYSIKKIPHDLRDGSFRGTTLIDSQM